MSDEMWLASHVRLWMVARVARRWLRGFRERAAARLRVVHGGVLGLLEAGLTPCEMGGELADEAAAAAAAVEGSCRRRCGSLGRASERGGAEGGDPCVCWHVL